MKVQEIMSRGVEVIAPTTSLEKAAEKMRSLDIGPLPVCDGDRLVGMVTDRDITVRATAEGRDPQKTTVGEVMTPDIVYCFEDEDVERAAQLMEEKQIRRLVVLNRDKRLAGIVSLGDLAVETENQDLSGEVLTEVSVPPQPKR